MIVPFSSLPGHSRIWIYQSDKKLNEQDKHIISQALQAFTQQWQVHGQPMDASFDIRFDQFVILAANDQASGCSIDSSVRAIKELGASLGIDFFNRNLVAFKKEDVILITLAELKRKQEEGFWDKETLVFNNLVNNKEGLDTMWLVSAGSTWLKRYLPKKEEINI